MEITPTTLGKAKYAGSKIAVYDVEQKKPVLIFKSIYFCVKYLFYHRIFKKADDNKYGNLVRKCYQKKDREDINIFAKNLTYRLANDDQKEALSNMDYIILDEDFRNKQYESKGLEYLHKPYDLEKTLKQGDLVKIKYGLMKGYTARVLDIKNKKVSFTPGSKYFVLRMPNGELHDFKAPTLELI